MTSRKIARDYLPKVEARLEALRVYLFRERYDDVVREAHEAIELLLKGALRFVGVDPPRRHDPASILLRHLDRFPAGWRAQAPDICAASERLFAERGRLLRERGRPRPAVGAVRAGGGGGGDQRRRARPRPLSRTAADRGRMIARTAAKSQS